MVMDNRIDVALEAHRIIAPLLAPNLEAAEKRALREHILMTERISERTLRRMMQKFREGDDATRMVMHGEFYFHQRLPILEDCFRKALLSWGICDTVYLDNGKIFVSKWFRAACTHLGIRHLAAASYSPQSKGKIERFNRTVEEFFEELRLEPVSDLKELNRKFQLWLD
jgi:transposase InsO family protein